MLVTVLTTVIVMLVPPLSVAVGESNVQGVPAITVRFGWQVIVGGVVSRTVMAWMQLAWLPH